MSAAPKIEKKDSLTALFESLSFFNGFPNELIDQLRAATTLVQFDADDEIIAQGVVNTKLYFLLLGAIDVFVDGGRVATLSQRGNLIGEMSVINQSESLAQVRANTPVELFCIDTEELQKNAGEKQHEVNHLLYRIYSLILNEKLHETNQKAKHFEVTSEQLAIAKGELQEINSQLERKVNERTKDLRSKNNELHARNVELVASHKKMEDLYNSRDLTLSMLDDLRNNKLMPLETSLKSLVNQTSGGAQKQLDQSLSEVKSVLKVLEPVTDRFSSEKALKEKKVLIAESVRKNQVTAKMALGGTGVNFEIVGSLEEGREKLASDQWDVLIVDSELVDLANEVREKNPRADVVISTSLKIQDYLPILRKVNFEPNIVSRDENDRNFTIKHIMTTATKLASHDIFGLDKYLAWGVDLKEVAVEHSAQRGEIIAEAEEYFSSMGIRKSIIGCMSLVSEEILMNAIYDAPLDENGKSIYNHLDRSEKVVLKPEEQSRFRYACDGNLLAVSVEDPFGGLSQKIILDYLDACYGNRAGEHTSDDKGGAGRGLHQIIENSDLVVFNVAPGKRTEVIALFSTTPSKDAEKFPSFHYFSL